MPIGELSRRLGVSTDLLRKWERRYGVLKPGRTLGNRRLYSRLDEARVRLMLSHVREGVPAAQAAELAIAARFRITAPPGNGQPLDGASEVRERLLERLAAYDETGAEQVLEKLMATAAATTVICDVFLPLMRDIGEMWAQGDLRIPQEHFATGFVHTRLLVLARGWDRGLGPRAILACPTGEHHTLGLIAFGIALHQLGWRITYLGADTPLDAIEETVEVINPRLTVIAGLLTPQLQAAEAQLSALAQRTPVAVAGAAATGGLARRCGALHLDEGPVTAAQTVVTMRAGRDGMLLS